MTDWPKVWVLFGTYRRTEASLRTIENLGKYFIYPNLHYHICDDGSGETDDGTHRWHVGVLVEKFSEFYPEVTWHEMSTPPGQFNTGGNVNRGIRLAHDNGCDIHVLNFDDWSPQRPLDLRPMVDILEAYADVGFIRLSYAVPGNAGIVQRYDAPRIGTYYMWLRLIRDWCLRNPYGDTDSYMVSTQPYIAHKRFFDAYGYHPEHVNPGLAEVGLGYQYNSSPLGESGPQILFPYPGKDTDHAVYGHIAARANDYAKV